MPKHPTFSLLSIRHSSTRRGFSCSQTPEGGVKMNTQSRVGSSSPSAESGAAGPAGQRGRAWHPGTLRCRDTGVPSLLRIRWPKQKTKRNYMFLFHFPTLPPQLLLEQLQPNDNKVTFNTGED